MTDTTPLFTENLGTASTARMPEPGRRKVRAGTIVWGAILLLIASAAFLLTIVGFDNLGPNVLLWSIVGIGTLFVVIGIIGAIVRATTRN